MGGVGRSETAPFHPLFGSCFSQCRSQPSSRKRWYRNEEKAVSVVQLVLGEGDPDNVCPGAVITARHWPFLTASQRRPVKHRVPETQNMCKLLW